VDSWYNQPTAQIYTWRRTIISILGLRVAAGERSVGIRAAATMVRLRFGIGTGGDRGVWVCCSDPLHPDILYGGKFTKFDRRTGQIRTLPLGDPHGEVPAEPVAACDVLAGGPAHSLLRFDVLFKTGTGGIVGRKSVRPDSGGSRRA